MTVLQPDAPASGDFQRDLLALTPRLRAFARSLCGQREAADDLAQDALIKAWKARDRFLPGTNLNAWVFTIMRNEFFSQRRRAWRQTHWDEVKGEKITSAPDPQYWSMTLCDVSQALRQLPDAQREAVVLVGAGGFSYEEAAEICGAAVGTLKSRVARGRAALMQMMDGEIKLPQRDARALPIPGDIMNQLTNLTSPKPAPPAAAPPAPEAAKAAKDFQASRTYAQGWNAGRRLQQENGDDAASLNPYPPGPDRLRWNEGFFGALA